jgi:cell division protein FtsN
MKTLKQERGGFVLGMVAGLLIGLALALGVALYITKAPVPFIDKVPQRTAEQDQAEVEKNRSWDPNALLGGKPARPMNAPAEAASGAAAGASAPATTVIAPLPPAAPVQAQASAARPSAGARDPAAILAGAPTPAPKPDNFVYFVQAGAYTRPEDAEQQRARLAMLGQEAKVSEREQAGRVVYRVRLGPYGNRDDADSLQGKLQQQSIESQIVRAERP